MKRVTMDDLNYVMHRATKNIIEFPHGARLPDMKRPLTEGEARIVCLIEAVLSMADKDIEVIVTTPDSDSIFEQ